MAQKTWACTLVVCLAHPAGAASLVPDVAERARRHGYAWCFIAENIAYQYDSRGFATESLAHGIVEGWKKSAGHRRNLLAREATHTGVAVARSEKTGYYYAVQLFGRPC